MINRVLYTRCEDLFEKCKNYDVISLDIFDTSLIRLVDSPEDVFDIVGKKIGQKGFKERRLHAQVDAENKYHEKTNIELIYTEFVNNGSIDVPNALIALKTEQEIEESVCVARETIRDLTEKLVSMGKIVVFLSDMYIPGHTLSQILKSKGYEKFDRVIVSCDNGQNKIQGGAYDYLKYLYKGKKIIHIGDNLRTDYLNARKKGIQSLLIEKIKESGVNKLIVATKKGVKSPYQWGYAVMSKIAFGYMEWLVDELQNNKVDRILFLTREGAFFKKIYEKLYQERFIRHDLFYASRRSMLCALSHVESEFVKSYILETHCSLKEIYDIYNVGRSDANFLNERYNIKGFLKTDEISEYSKLMTDIYTISAKYISEQYELFARYVMQFDLVGKIAVVDIGWNGTMQYLLEKLIAKMELPIQISGYYLGVLSNTKLHYEIEKHGYLCDGKNEETLIAVTNAAYVFEQCFTPPIGSTIGYELEYGQVIPKKKRYSNNPVIDEIQNGIIDAISQINGYKNSIELIVDKISSLNPLKSPDKFYAVLLGNIKWIDVESVRYMAKPNNIISYIRNPHRILKDLQQSGWKSAFLLRLLKAPLPYYSIYKFMKGTVR